MVRTIMFIPSEGKNKSLDPKIFHVVVSAVTIEIL